MNDEHGMPVPGEVLTKADFVFCQHAFNYIIPCREIVRRLAEIVPEITPLACEPLEAIAYDALKLLARMQAKGGGDE